jgi:DNA-binding transcriptional MerR regulator
MRSGQLARLARVSSDTLRHYERVGILPRPARTAGNYRDYPPSSLRRVELIQRALTIGFSIAELKSILAVRDQGGAPCRQAREILRSKIVELSRAIGRMKQLRHQLQRLSRNWDRRLRRAKPDQPARLLERISGLTLSKEHASFSKIYSRK